MTVFFRQYTSSEKTYIKENVVKIPYFLRTYLQNSAFLTFLDIKSDLKSTYPKYYTMFTDGHLSTFKDPRTEEWVIFYPNSESYRLWQIKFGKLISNIFTNQK